MALLLRLHESASLTDVHPAFRNKCKAAKARRFTKFINPDTKKTEIRYVPKFLTKKHLLEKTIRAMFQENQRCTYFLIKDSNEKFKKMVEEIIVDLKNRFPREAKTIISTDCLKTIYEKLVWDYTHCILIFYVCFVLFIYLFYLFILQIFHQ